MQTFLPYASFKMKKSKHTIYELISLATIKRIRWEKKMQLMIQGNG